MLTTRLLRFRAALLAAAVAPLLFAGGCNRNDAVPLEPKCVSAVPEGWTQHAAEQGNWRLSLPAGWNLQFLGKYGDTDSYRAVPPGDSADLSSRSGLLFDVQPTTAGTAGRHFRSFPDKENPLPSGRVYLSQISRDTDATSYAIVVGGNAALFSTANLDDAHGPIVPTIIDSFGEACP